MFAVAIALGLVLGLIVLLVLQVLTSLRVQRLTYPVYEYAESKAQAQADRIVNEAKEKARSIIATAQAQAAELIQKQESDVQERTKAYHDALNALEKSAHQKLEESAKDAQAGETALFAEITKDVRTRAEAMKGNISSIETAINEVLQHTKTEGEHMSRAFEADSAKAVTELASTFQHASEEGKKRLEAHVDALFVQVQSEIESYREARKRVIDAHMADLVAETARVVLRTSLTSDDHAALVRRALEEAKAAGAL